MTMSEEKIEMCYWNALRLHAVNNDQQYGDTNSMWLYLGAASAFGAMLGKDDEDISSDVAVAMRDEYAEFPERLKSWEGSV